jgi:mono/diheme cytochrome c family protein
MHFPDFSSLAARRAGLAAVILMSALALGMGLARSLSAHEGHDHGTEAQTAGQAAGKSQSDEQGGWEAPAEAKKTPNPIAADEASIARGLAIFTKTCASCHGPEGRGDGKSAKILAKKPADLNHHAPHHTDGDLFWKITEGKKPMPSFKKDLKPQQRWDVVNYLRKLTGPAEAKGDSAKKAAKADAAEPKAPPVMPEQTNPGHSHEGHGGY